MYQLWREWAFYRSRNDAEIAHHMGIEALMWLERHPWLLEKVRKTQAVGNPKPVTVFGVTFPNSLGVAAGLTKNAEALDALQAMGFGFIEAGTILPRPQAGNPRPRLFRIKEEEEAIINRMGFNSEGAQAVDRRLRAYENRGTLTVPIGLSLGKMKDTPNEEAAKDYIKARNTLKPYGNYLVANVSSPNTPNLRELQRDLEQFLHQLVENETRICGACEKLHDPLPYLVKIAPDEMDDPLLDSILEAIIHAGVRGIIVGNATTSRSASFAAYAASKEQGGLSAPCTFADRRALVARVAYKAPKLPIVAVGGIDTAQKNSQMHDAGAALTQIYAPFIYKGPPLVREIRMSL